MQTYLAILLLAPFIAAIGIFYVSRYVLFLVFSLSVLLVGSSVFAYISFESAFILSIPALNPFVVAADAVLLLYFASVGWKNRHKPILALSIVQIVLLGLLESFDAPQGFDILVDRLSVFMFLLINIVGSLILLYTLRYIRDETDDPLRQRLFLSLLSAFLGIMNLLVSTDNLQWLFLFFELTTLASFWLIGFRRNEESLDNARTALWMNQIGGVALLGAALVAKVLMGSIYLSEIVSEGGGYVMLFAAFFSLSALIKGAQIPFSGWLLGAMVAPAPVSAILHSSTMVKIAPYFLLKISPLLALTMLGWIIALIGAVSFLVSAALALREDNFKKILAYSTISLLGLMVLTAALATPLSVLACLLLIVFHGISKALLFMCAGIAEKRYRIKSIESVQGLFQRAPLLSLLVVLGFVSIALPPFGVFFAKWLVYEGGNGAGGVTTVILLLFIAVGSVALTLLYFKTIGRFLTDGAAQREKEDYRYLIPPAILGVLLLVFALFISVAMGGFFRETAADIVLNPVPVWGDKGGIILPFGQIKLWHILAAFFLLGIAPLLAAIFRFKGVDRVMPYTCGERIETDAYSFYFDPAGKIESFANLLSLVLFLLVILAGAFNL
ncbi:proton-conducting transporter membrane subunit [Sulfuricurvum sp. UBA5598]|nr:proton-conducting transporter membrane subunit [Sulfuricurvum sp. UBA5598]